jgi:hypothetical protein
MGFPLMLAYQAPVMKNKTTAAVSIKTRAMPTLSGVIGSLSVGVVLLTAYERGALI